MICKTNTLVQLAYVQNNFNAQLPWLGAGKLLILSTSCREKPFTDWKCSILYCCLIHTVLALIDTVQVGDIDSPFTLELLIQKELGTKGVATGPHSTYRGLIESSGVVCVGQLLKGDVHNISIQS